MKNIAFLDLHKQQAKIKPQLDRAIQRVLTHGQYIMGPEVALLEQALQTYTEAKHVISCASGTEALTLLLMTKGIGAGDAVFVPAFSFVATCEVVAMLGATPIFIDIDPNRYVIDIESLIEGIEKAKKSKLNPKGIIAVDLYGLPADYEKLNLLASAYHLWVIADAAQSFGARSNGKRVGNLTEMSATSFFPSKPLGCYGDGGAVFLNDDILASQVKSLRVHGQGNERYYHDRIGINSRLDTIQAAILLEKLHIFDEEQVRRKQIASYYQITLSALAKNDITLPVTLLDKNVESAWALYTLQCGNKAQRDLLKQDLKDKGIPSIIYYPKALHEQEPYAHFPRATPHLPVAEKLADCVLSIPMHPYLTDEEVEYIAQSICLSVTATSHQAKRA